jgi:hypothetical protein
LDQCSRKNGVKTWQKTKKTVDKGSDIGCSDQNLIASAFLYYFVVL